MPKGVSVGRGSVIVEALQIRVARTLEEARGEYKTSLG